MRAEICTNVKCFILNQDYSSDTGSGFYFMRFSEGKNQIVLSYYNNLLKVLED
jgi:hypothetical protein